MSIYKRLVAFEKQLKANSGGAAPGVTDGLGADA